MVKIGYIILGLWNFGLLIYSYKRNGPKWYTIFCGVLCLFCIIGYIFDLK